jgi:preprotein translocase subunit SecA
VRQILRKNKHPCIETYCKRYYDRNRGILSLSSKFTNCLSKATFCLEIILTETCFKKAELTLQTGGLIVILDGIQKAKRLEDQLKGRAGRQGMVGESRPFVSTEESLVRTFAKETFERMISSGINSIQNHDNLFQDEDLWLQSSVQIKFARVLKRCQSTIEQFHFASRFVTRTYGNFLFRFTTFIKSWQKMFIFNSSANNWYFIQTTLYNLTERMADFNLLKIYDSRTREWGFSLITMIDEIRCIFHNYDISNNENTPTSYAWHHMCNTFDNFVDDKTDVFGINRWKNTLNRNQKMEKYYSSTTFSAKKMKCKAKKIVIQNNTKPMLMITKSDETLQYNKKFARDKSLTYTTIVEELVVGLISEKMFMIINFEWLFSQDSVINSVVRPELETISKIWPFFLEDLTFLQNYTYLSAFAFLLPSEEFGKKAAIIFFSLQMDTRFLISKQLVSIKCHYQNKEY